MRELLFPAVNGRYATRPSGASAACITIDADSTQTRLIAMVWRAGVPTCLGNGQSLSRSSV